MSAFRRKTTSVPQNLPAGTRASQSLSTLLLTSSGISSFDDVLGGGIQLGTSVLLLNQDLHSAHTDLLAKYFLAQGLAVNQKVYVYDADGRAFVESCMWLPSQNLPHYPHDEDEAANAMNDQVKIAWRYERMEKFKTTVSTQSADQEDYCRKFDLSSRIPRDVVEKLMNDGQLSIMSDVFSEIHDVFELVLQGIEGVLLTSNSSSKTQDNQCPYRILFRDFGGPAWGDPSLEQIILFLLQLRSLLRRFPIACAFITLSTRVFSLFAAAEDWLEKISWVTDACIQLNSFTADPSAVALFPRHHGLLRIHKLPCVQTLVSCSDRFSFLRGIFAASTSMVSSGGVCENNLAFRCTRKRFIIETFHLDVEGGVGERRTTPAPSAVTLQETAAHESTSTRPGDPEASLQRPLAAIEVSVEHTRQEETSMQEAGAEDGKMPVQGVKVKKKSKKKVGFQVDRPELYDF